MIRRAKVQFGFSIAGAAFLLMLFTPNIIWARNQPPGYTELATHENRILLTLERVGQVAVTCASIAFVSPKGFSMPWLLWLVAALVLMVLYEAAWIRYFKGGKELINMYAPLGFIPLPLATLPVAAFILLGIWCQSPIAVLAAVILGIGHIGIHLGHARELFRSVRG